MIPQPATQEIEPVVHAIVARKPQTAGILAVDDG
jgi:hypothetical protein